jgi:hypothetical protein
MRGKQNRLLGHSIPTKLVDFSKTFHAKSVAENNLTYKQQQTARNSKKNAHPSVLIKSFLLLLLTRKDRDCLIPQYL